MTKENLFKCLKLTSPIFFGYISIGIPFGLLVTQAGYPWWLAPIMGLTMYTGSGQYIAIGLFAAGAPLTEIIIAQLMTGCRHIFYGLSLMTQFKDTGKWKPYLIFALTDETYALLVGTKVPPGIKNSTFYGTISMLDQSYWILGSIIGAIAGSLIKFPLKGLDFALTALFAVILTEQIMSSKDFIPPVVGLTASAVAIILEKVHAIPSGNMLLVSLTLGIAALMIAKRSPNTSSITADAGGGNTNNKSNKINTKNQTNNNEQIKTGDTK